MPKIAFGATVCSMLMMCVILIINSDFQQTLKEEVIRVILTSVV